MRQILRAKFLQWKSVIFGQWDRGGARGIDDLFGRGNLPFFLTLMRSSSSLRPIASSWCIVFFFFLFFFIIKAVMVDTLECFCISSVFLSYRKVRSVVFIRPGRFLAEDYVYTGERNNVLWLTGCAIFSKISYERLRVYSPTRQILERDFVRNTNFSEIVERYFELLEGSE